MTALLVTTGLSCAHAAPVAAGTWVLERAVLLQRHGVRAPTDAPAALARYSAQPWPQWPVGPGELTAGGGRALAVMGSYIRARYAGLGLLPLAGCPAPEQLYVWADSGDERTRASGVIMASELAPRCSIVAAHHAVSRRDPLFHPLEGGLCPFDAQTARAQIMARVDGNLNALGPRYERARQALQAVLWPGAGHCSGSDARCPMLGRNRLTIAHGKLKLTGPLKVGATLSEDLELEYTDGLPVSEVGWGRAATARQLEQILPLHDGYSDLLRRTPEVAASGGTPLAHLMLLLLEQKPAAGAFAAAPPVPPTARLVVLAGHDTNLANVGAMLGLHWTLPDQPDSTAPDTTLALELWHNVHDGHQYVRAVVLYQTLDQLRAAAMGTRADSHSAAAHTLLLSFPGCTSSRCPLDVVSARIENRMNRRCAQ